jgi:hypothetical protein
MAVDALAQKLRQLLAEGNLASSRLTERDRSRLRSLFETGVLEVARSGAGKTVVVKNRDAFDAFILQNYPSGLEGRAESSTPRSKAVAELRDSKKARETGQPIVLLRGFDNCELRSGTEVLPVAELTELAGVVAFHLGAREWEYTGLLAVVENLEVFWHFEKLGTGVEMALYAGGRLSGRILGWLSSQSMARARIIHCGDYDPVGLDEYLRLKGACPERAELFLPSGLEALLSRYGKRELLQGRNGEVLARLRKVEDIEVRRVVTMLDRYGVGLEQEILLLA